MVKRCHVPLFFDFGAGKLKHSALCFSFKWMYDVDISVFHGCLTPICGYVTKIHESRMYMFHVCMSSLWLRYMYVWMCCINVRDCNARVRHACVSCGYFTKLYDFVWNYMSPVWICCIHVWVSYGYVVWMYEFVMDVWHTCVYLAGLWQGSPILGAEYATLQCLAIDM